MSARREHHVGIAALAALCFLALVALTPARASALTQSPQWAITSVSQPANFAPGDSSDSYMVTATNTGGAPTDGSQVSIADTLPPQLTATEISAQDLSSSASLSCELSSLTCTTTGPLGIGDQVEVRITFAVPASPSSGTYSNSATVSGGAAAPATTAPEPTTISTAPGSFGLAPGSFFVTPSATQAGAHADLTTQFTLRTDAGGSTDGFVRNVVVDLPPGFSGDPNAVPTCTEAQLMGKGGGLAACPANSQLGTIEVTINFFGEAQGIPFTFPIYNIEVPPGAVAVLGFNLGGAIVQDLVVTVRPGDSGLEITTPNIQGVAEIDGVSVTLWGVPADPVHDPMRGQICEFGGCFGGGNSASIEPLPYLSNSTRCAAALTATISANSWEDPARQQTEEASIAPMSGCERLGFTPSLTVAPTSLLAETPTGLNVGITLPQTYENPEALATSHLKNVTVTLPRGVTVNPSAGVGLGACTPAQYAAEALVTPPGEGCPNDSSLGTVTIHTPVLKEEATGSVYLATPYDNPFPEAGHPGGSLLALYIVARIPNRGVIVKVAGKATLNPVTGQLVTTFQENPQLPFDRFTLSFRPGEAAPLVTPPACGSYSALGQFSSWSEPEALLSAPSPESEFGISQGVGGGACPSGGVPPFAPQVISGTQNNLAASYSPFYLRIVRNDGEQEITKFSTVLPPGLTGNLSGIPFCPDGAIEAARGRTGTQETAEPSCPAASEIGHTLVGAGVGGILAQAPGKVYLAGPYHGSALSIVSITSATVGPFDLGTVVIRFALDINPITAQVEINGATSDPIPHIIRGIVVHVRDIRVYINRPNFILNPTSCDRMSIAATITGAGADPANPADGVPVTATSPFQAADCQNLAFKPKLSASTTGKDSFNNQGASLTVKLAANQGPSASTGQGVEANIHAVKVELPRALPSRLTTLQKACTAAQFNTNPAGCPAASNIGYATVHTPILPVPLTGPAIFVSHGGQAFPSLILVLQGYGITIDLTGATFISKSGITSSTFKTVPDQPFSSFELTLPTGKFSALAAITNVCKPTKKATVSKLVSVKRHGKTVKVRKRVTATVAAQLLMPTEITAQNGAVLKQSTKITVTGCPKAKKVKPAKKHGKAKGKKGKKK